MLKPETTETLKQFVSGFYFSFISHVQAALALAYHMPPRLY